MKNLTFIIMISLILFSCGPSEEEKENAALKTEVERLKAENKELQTGKEEMQSSINEFNKFLKEVEANLASIDENQGMLSKISKEGQNSEDMKEVISTRIAQLKELMENSKLKIINMDKSLANIRRESGDKSEEILALDQEFEGLTRDLMEREKQIEELNKELTASADRYDLKFAESEELKEIINRAFMITGESKELKEKGIITKEGGFIGIGRVKVLNANANDSLFTQIRKEDINEIALGVKSVNIISIHADDSYNLVENEEGIEKLEITDKDKFWKDGNYLVIETKE